MTLRILVGLITTVSKQVEDQDIKGSVLVFFVKLIGWLPLPVAGSLGHILGHLVWMFAATPKKVTLKNLELCYPDLSEHERRKLGKASMLETIRTAFEVATAWNQPPEKLLKLITHSCGEELLNEALEQKKGIVFIVPHFGNWELANYYMASKCRLLAMYKPAESAALDKMIYRARSQNTQMVAADRRGVVALYRALPSGMATGVLPDQEPTVKSGVWVRFFGVTALTPRLVSKITNDTNSIAIGFGCQRNPDSKSFHVFYEPVDADFYSDDIMVSAAAMNRCVERIINRDPKQYQWEYKRFKRRPNREPGFYK